MMSFFNCVAKVVGVIWNSKALLLVAVSILLAFSAGVLIAMKRRTTARAGIVALLAVVVLCLFAIADVYNLMSDALVDMDYGLATTIIAMTIALLSLVIAWLNMKAFLIGGDYAEETSQETPETPPCPSESGIKAVYRNAIVDIIDENTGEAMGQVRLTVKRDKTGGDALHLTEANLSDIKEVIEGHKKHRKDTP
ncbi:MAG: hypothetical protein LBQ02_01360 [Candidatus Nomurabacteria bacterium]|jgi:hypothetical protein|nr:hypothetical protein [Candidatus Nomurabacteria bacterium]